MLETRLLSSLAKIFPDEISGESLPQTLAMRNEPLSFQIAYRSSRLDRKDLPFYIQIESDLDLKNLASYKEGYVPVVHAATLEPDDYYDRTRPGLYPDLDHYTAIEGVKPVKTGERDRLTAGRTVFVASAKCENIEALLTWWNYLSSSTEMKYTVSAGEKGGTWDIEDGKVVERVFTEVEEGVDYGYTYGVGGSRCPLIRKDELAVLSADMENDNYYRQTMVDVVWDYL